MAQLSFDTKVSKSADEAWKVVGSFDGIDAYFPGVDSCEVSGDVRTLSAMGATIKERELERDDAGRMYAYSIIEGPFPLTHHKTTVRIEEADEGSVVILEVEVEPDDVAGTMEAVYQAAVEAMKEAIEA